MSEPTIDEAPQAPAEKKIGPGARLREAREIRKLTVEGAASQMHIDPNLLRALEEDDYDKFAAPIFVTGHLRAYARLLDLVPEPLIDAYHRLGLDKPPPLKQVSRRLNFGSASSVVPGIIIVLVLGLAVALFAGLQNGDRGAFIAPEDNNALPEPASAPMPSDDPGATQESDAGIPDGVVPGTTPLPSKTSAAAPTSTPPSLPAFTATPQPAIGPRATLSLKADRASWVEVRDAGGRRLLYDLLDPGASRNVDGVAPFDVLLGYGPGVAVEFNGRLIDHRRYMHDDVARFRVGEKGIDKL